MTRPLSGELLVAKLTARRGIDCEYLFKRKDCSWFRIRIARPLPRGEFFAGLFTLGCVSGLASPIIRSVSRLGWADALFNTFEISLLVWISCAAGYLFFIETERLGVRSSELAMGAGFVFLAVLPIGPLSWLAVTALSLYIIISTNVASSRRGAFILLATTVPMLWSRLLLQFFCQPNIADRRVTCWLDIGHSSDRGHG